MSTDHGHGWFTISHDPLGRLVDSRLLGQVIGASFDSCTTCQEALSSLLGEDPTTTARLVELACMATDAADGGLPPSMTQDTVPGPASLPFRALARAGADGANEQLFTGCAAMSPHERVQQPTPQSASSSATSAPNDIHSAAASSPPTNSREMASFLGRLLQVEQQRRVGTSWDVCDGWGRDELGVATVRNHVLMALVTVVAFALGSLFAKGDRAFGYALSTGLIVFCRPARGGPALPASTA